MNHLQHRWQALRRQTEKLARILVLFIAAGLLAPSFTLAGPAGKAEHVVMMVWDGMRPDFIRPQYTPTLYALVKEGVFFKSHHAVCLSSTEVNGTALITGVYPEHSGITANKVYWPEMDRMRVVATEDLDVVRRGDKRSGGHYIEAPTLTEILEQAGFRTAVAGTKPVAVLLNRSQPGAAKPGKRSVNFFKGHTLPRSALGALIRANDDEPFPSRITYPNVKQDAWTTRALIQGLWRKDVPKLSVLWLSDPDYSQHEHGPGSDEAIAALESADDNLAAVLRALQDKGVRDTTDIFIVSDHGFSTVNRAVDLVALLKKSKFRAVKQFEDDPEPGDIFVVPLGGSAALYVVGHDQSIVRDLVDFFQVSDFAGVIFSTVPMDGTFPLSNIRLATTNAPDLLVSLRWSAGLSELGVPGLVVSDGNAKRKGTHASLSPFDMRNTLVAVGPDFRTSFIDELPSGNADLAPTILSILGIQPPHPMDGRVLTEALSVSSGLPPKAEQKTIEASRTGSLFHWRQYLKFSNVGQAVYFDEGNGESSIK
jgi:arylsulfatase A-like enzyme